MKNRVKKLITGIGIFLTSLCTMCVPALADDDVSWIQNGSEDGGALSSLVTKVKGLGQDAYTLMVVIGATVIVVCLIVLGIGFGINKQAVKRDENKTWLFYILILRSGETREPGGLPSFIGGANPPDGRKEGVANGYIF